jgi:hypothetical protein
MVALWKGLRLHLSGHQPRRLSLILFTQSAKRQTSCSPDEKKHKGSRKAVLADTE